MKASECAHRAEQQQIHASAISGTHIITFHANVGYCPLILQALASLGVLARDDQGAYALTELADCLVNHDLTPLYKIDFKDVDS